MNTPTRPTGHFLRGIQADFVTAFLVASILTTALSQDAKKGAAGAQSSAGASDVIGGVVVDEKDQPIPDAQVEIIMRPGKNRFEKPALPVGYKAPGPVKTDAKGRWQLAGVPAGVMPGAMANASAGRDTYGFHVTHPDFLYLRWSGDELDDDAAFRQGTAKCVLERGLPLRGVVLDEAGQPIAGATVERNLSADTHGDPKAITDAAGRYEMRSARAGDLATRVRAKGYATHLQRIKVSAETTQDFTLKKGHALSLKVRDEQDRPVAGAVVSFYYPGYGWKAADMLWKSEGTGADGVVTWNEAPSGEVIADVTSAGHTRVSSNVTAGAEQVIKLPAANRLPVITFKVTDAATGAPLSGCTISTGTMAPMSPERMTPSSWMPEEMSMMVKPGASAGEYEATVRENLMKYHLVSCVRREGYLPRLTSRIRPKDGDTTVSVALEKAPPPVNVSVLDPQGTPLPEAKVYVFWQSRFMSLRDFVMPVGSLGGDELEFAGITGADGNVTVSGCPADSSVLVLHPSGFAVMAYADMARSRSVRLGLYASVEANVTRRGKPAPGVKLSFGGSFDLPNGNTLYQVFNATSDAQGHISLPRVLPTRGGFRETMPSYQKGRFRASAPSMGYQRVAVGRPTVFEVELNEDPMQTITGRFVIQGSGAPAVSREGLMSMRLSRRSQTGMFMMAGSAVVEGDGRFTLEGVAPGEYFLEVSNISESAPFVLPEGKPRIEFSVPELSPDTTPKPFDLGDIEVVATRK